jgi:hypothetical protein
MFTICGTHWSDGFLCITYDGGAFTVDDEVMQYSFDSYLANNGPFYLEAGGKVFEITDDPAANERSAYYYLVSFFEGPLGPMPPDLTVTPAGYLDAKVGEWFSPVEGAV